MTMMIDGDDDDGDGDDDDDLVDQVVAKAVDAEHSWEHVAMENLLVVVRAHALNR
jgi:hypothetical protein